MKKVDRLIHKLEKYKKEKSNKMRSEKEIDKLVQKFEDIIWWNRHKDFERNGRVHKEGIEPAKRIENKYSKDELLFADEFDWGMINGKLSALRWILGDEWDNLDI